MSLSTFDCIPDFQGCRPLCALCCGRIGQTWHKQPKTGMLQLCKNGHSVKRTVFPVPHKGVRVGGQYGTRPSEKRRTRLLQNLNSQILFKQKQRRTSSRLHGFVSPNLYQRDVIGLGFCEADPIPWQGCRVSMVRIAWIAAGPLGPSGRTDQA